MEYTDKKTRISCRVRWIVFLFYVLLLIYLLFFSEFFGRGPGVSHRFSMNLIPFHEIRRYLTQAPRIGAYYVCTNLIGNIVCFMPFGYFLTRFFYRKHVRRIPAAVTLLSAAFSASVEILQFLTSTGCADVDDVILNTLGGFLGWLITWLVLRRKGKGSPWH